MNNEEKILEILASVQTEMKGMRTEIKGMQAEMKGMQAEIKEIHGKLDELTEAHEETRTSVNAILEWTEKVSDAVNFPLPRI